MTYARSQVFSLAQAKARSMTDTEFYEHYKDLVWPTDEELKQLVKEQEKKDRKYYKRTHPGRMRKLYRRIIKRFQRKPKLCFKGLEYTGDMEEFKNQICLRTCRYVYSLQEYCRNRNKPMPEWYREKRTKK
jgi:hypothetical protein